MMRNWGIAIAIALIVFAGALAAIVGSRLSEQTVMLLAGAACGAGLTTPFAVLGGMLLGAQRAARERQPTPSQPPIVVMTPQQQGQAAALLPAWGSSHSATLSATLPEPRQFTILGEETVIDGAHHVW